MKTLKTYGVKGLLEWQAVIKSGKTTMRVCFTGGALNAYGITPAEFSTRNPVVQKVIEHSNYFKEGRIILLRSVTIDDADHNAEDNKEEYNNELTKVTVTCLEDAAEYLKEKFGYRNLRNKVSIEKIAAEKGIVFEGIE